MLIASWNVNGLRAILKKDDLHQFISQQSPDILCLQETRVLPEQVDHDFEGYHAYWNPAEKKGYSGTATFTKNEPLDVRQGIGKKEHDNEGRVLTLEFKDWFLVNVYTPNSQKELARLDYRKKKWDPAFLKFLKQLEKKKPVIFCGDLNVAHKEIDLARPKNNTQNAGFTPEEREGFDKIVDAEFTDTWRHFHPDTTDRYTWWTYIGGARKRNVGWRIDYFCVSPALLDQIERAHIFDDVMGSDHCPVGITLK